MSGVRHKGGRPGRQIGSIMQPAELHDLATEMWGEEWPVPLSRALMIHTATVYRYQRALQPIPGPVAVAVRLLWKEHMRAKRKPAPAGAGAG